jgi:hypothetical protein
MNCGNITTEEAENTGNDYGTVVGEPTECLKVGKSASN